jgi:hypothetical protein
MKNIKLVLKSAELSAILENDQGVEIADDLKPTYVVGTVDEIMQYKIMSLADLLARTAASAEDAGAQKAEKDKIFKRLVEKYIKEIEVKI